MMFDSRSLLFLLFDSLLGLGGIFVVMHYFSKQKRGSTSESITGSPEIETLRQECLRLRAQLQQQSDELTDVLQESIFRQLQTLFTLRVRQLLLLGRAQDRTGLTNYPSVCQMVQAKPNLPAKNLTSLFTPLDNLLESWNYETIGSAWQQVPYNPQLHQPDSADIAEGELVYIRFVGYQNGDRILCPTKVSLTLPGGVK